MGYPTRSLRRLSCHLIVGLSATTAIAQTPSSGCGSKPLESGLYQMADGGQMRLYRLHVPASYDPAMPSPVVTIFHGWGGDENAFLGDESVLAEAEAHGYILVAPRGVGSEGGDNSYNSWTFRGSATGIGGDGQPICDSENTGDYGYASCQAAGADIARNSCSWTQCQTDDIGFVQELIADVSSKICIDEDRIFASGGSNGGMFTWELGQNPATAGTFRAIAPLIGLPHRGHLDGPGQTGLPVMLVTGTNDPTVPPGAWEDSAFTTTSDGDFYYYTGATAITRVWAETAGCSVAEPASTVDVGIEGIDCRSYCGVEGEGEMPSVMDCRADMAHEYDLPNTWPLILGFFDAQTQ